MDLLCDIRQGFCAGCEFARSILVSALLDLQVESNKIGAGKQELEFDLIVSLELNRGGATFRTGPKWCTIIILGIWWEQGQKIFNLMVEVLIKVISCNLHAVFKSIDGLHINNFLDFSKGVNSTC